MTIETVLIKRRALYRGEIGFFANNEMSEEDLALATMNQEVIVRWYRPRTIEKLRYLWGVVYKTWQNTDLWIDKDAAMEDLKTRVRYTKRVYDRTTERYKEVPKSLTRINDEQLRLLTDRIIDIICRDVLPGMKHAELRAEIEEMFKDRTQETSHGTS
jgi:hypothetical protein